jgi:hypothetical protein
MKPMLKPPATKHLKLECDERLSNFAFNCNLRRYTMGLCALSPTQDSTVMACPGLNKVGRCRLTASNPVLKALTTSALETGIS